MLRSRRRFFRHASLAAAGGLLLPAALPRLVQAASNRFVRVRGRVESSGRGLGGVRVSDGTTVVATQPDGTYELIADALQPFVFVSLPAGYALPQNPTGTARFYQPLHTDQEELEASFALEALPGGDEVHRFVVLADTQMQNAFEVGRYLQETVPDVQATLAAAEPMPTFGVGCGDMLFDDLTLFPDYEEGVQQMGVPFFQVVGNHDIEFDARSDVHAADTFRRHFGPTYYSFDRGAVHYVVLDDVLWHGGGYLGYLDEQQLTWLEQDLAFVEAGRTVVVFHHIPALSTRFRREGGQRPQPNNAIMNRDVLYRMLEPYTAHLIAGHTHEKEHVFEGGVHGHVSGAACGAWWSGDICWDGTPNGYDVFTARGEELQWQYKSTGHDLTHQLRTYAVGADPGAPDEFVVNIWDWDPEWEVVWFEGSDRTGAMTPRLGRDPLARTLHDGPDLPRRRPWVEAIPTDHLLYARPTTPGASLRVEATDRFGRTHTATVG
ncbi:MAG: calcineurin-like phosphoesterase family protein [Bacteroidota bacterium]